MEVVHQKIAIRAESSRLVDLRQFLRDFCEEHHISCESRNRLVLAADEAVSNIMEHSEVPPDHPIEISVEIGEDEIVVEIRDHGIAFDPRAIHTAPVSEFKRAKRGFGLYLIQLITNSLDYERTESSENVLTLTVENG